MDLVSLACSYLGSTVRDNNVNWICEVLSDAGLPYPEPDSFGRGTGSSLIRWLANRGFWVISPCSVVRSKSLHVLLQQKVRPGDFVVWRGCVSWWPHLRYYTGIIVEMTEDVLKIITDVFYEVCLVELKLKEAAHLVAGLPCLYGAARLDIGS